ncbi:response regulator [Nonomuraea typhae]|uniref:response regulator n=1 Tax=Nonomuraea typhae TaxID=2603600 RepID=UPI0012FB7354|nr:response regulator transcription factor [Nonomuraea typhae]
MIRLAVVDDQPAVRQALRFYLRSEPDIEIVAEAGDGQAAEEVARRFEPDVMLIDIRMPGTDGLTAIRRICARGPRPAVLALTTFDLDEYLFGTLRAGAAGFLLKDGPPEMYIQAVRLAHRGHGLIDPQVTRRLIQRFAHGTPPSPGILTAPAETLTPREHDIVRHVARGLSNRDVARRLGIGEGTVKTHMNHIFAKLNLQSRAQVVIYAYENGIVTPGDPA